MFNICKDGVLFKLCLWKKKNKNEDEKIEIFKLGFLDLVNSLHIGSLNIGLRAVISVLGRACHAVTIYTGKVLQTYVITRFVTTNE